MAQEITIKLNADGSLAVYGLKQVEKALQGVGGTANATAAQVAGMGADVAAGLQKAELSAKQLQAATRNLPAQFTDIFVSLQGGQSPMTVLFQQGGQLKDMFGGVGAAASAMGGYVVGLINPITLLGGAAAALGVAMHQAAAEQEALRDAIALSGNAAGVSLDQLNAMAMKMGAGFGKTSGAASDALAVMVRTGQVGRSSLEQYAETAMLVEKKFGISIDKTAEHFAELGKDPVGASKKLDESMNYLTASTYRQILAAIEAGDKAKAAALAQQEYDTALNVSAANAYENLGYVERVWRGIIDGVTGAWKAMKEVWDWIKGLGRQDPLEDQLEKARARLKDRQDSLAQYGNRGGFGGTTKDQIDAEQAKIDKLTEQIRLQKIAGDERAREIAAQKLGQAAAEKESEDRKEARKKAQSAAEAAAKAQQKLIEDGVKLYDDLFAKGSGLAANFQEDWDKLAAAHRAGKLSTQELTEAQAALLDQQPYMVKARSDEARLLKQISDEQSKTIDAAWKQVDAIQAQIDAQARANATFGLGKSAIAEMTLAEYESQMASLQATDRVIPGYINALQMRINKQRELIAGLKAGEQLDSAKTAISDFDKLIGQINQAKLNNIFAPLTDGAFKFIGALQSVNDLADKTSKALQANQQVNANDPAKMAKERARIEQEASQASVSAYATMTGALRGYGKEGSKTYQALLNAEKVFRAFELASAVQNAVVKSGLLTAFTSAKVASDTTMMASATAGAATEIAATTAVTAAKATEGVVNQAGGDPYSAFPRMAAMAAIMAGLGFATGAFGGGGGSAAPTNSGTGTVFGGGKDAKSESFAHSLDLLNGIQDEALLYSKAMAASLRSIEAAMGGFTNVWLRTGGTDAITGGIATGKMDTGLSRSMSFGKDLLPLGGVLAGIATSLFGKSVNVTGSGFGADAQHLSDILAKGFGGYTYADVNTQKKAFGFTYSNSTSEQRGALDPALERQITAIFGGVGSAVGSAADLLGQDLGGVQQRLQNYVVNIGRVDLQGLDGKQISEKLAAVFGAESDKLAQSVIPGFDALQKVGEGYFETLTRVSTEFESVNAYMARLGDTLGLLGMAGASAADDLVQAMGGLDKYRSSISSYYQSFYTDAERNARAAAELDAAMGRMGLSVPATLQGFRDLVNAQDLTTAAGRSTYAALIQLSPAFADVAKAAADAAAAVADQKAGLQDQLVQALGDTAAQRAKELAALDPGNRALQLRIWLIEDEKAAVAAAKTSTDAALNALQRAVDAEKKTAQARLDVAKQNISALQSVFDTLKTSVADLYGTVQTTAQASYQQSRDFIDQALGTAKATGYLPENAALQAAIQTVKTGMDKQTYASAFEAMRDRLVLAGKLSQLKDVGSDQLSTAERQLRAAQYQLDTLDATLANAQSQLDALLGIDKTLLSIDAAMANFSDAAASLSAATQRSKAGYNASTDVFTSAAGKTYSGAALGVEAIALAESGKTMELYNFAVANGISSSDLVGMANAAGSKITVDQVLQWTQDKGVPAFAAGGLHTGGLRIVGENGPELEATGPARIFNASQTRAMLQGGSPELLAEVQALRADNQAQARAMVQLQARLTKLMERWDGDGMPEVRSVAA